MLPNPYQGIFIVFEGLDGSGQSTQVKFLGDFLIKKGYQVVLTKEPTLESRAGKKIREILEEKQKISPKKLQELFAKDREKHLKKLIIPALKKGKIVISDRYFFSSFAYGKAGGVSLEYLFKLNENFILPDITFFLKVSPKICIQRIIKRGEKITLFEKEKKFAKVWEVYQLLPQKIKNANIKILNGEKPIKEVLKEVKKELSSFIKN